MVFGTSLSEVIETEFWLLIISSPTILASIFISIFCLITIGASRARARNPENQFSGRRTNLWKSRFIFVSYRQERIQKSKIFYNLQEKQILITIGIYLSFCSECDKPLFLQLARQFVWDCIWRLWNPFHGSKSILFKQL